ncbi:putative Ser/Thr protein kinase [Kitasatospora sp. MAP12-15]|uniref:protein kinase domain-containing protein n=1 Tax=unclassified Kitasatospora TaxID=2633591 RepID=UPI002473D2BA|nr:protein kinase [Kitasatospora sp. MAP12-44]MDH6111287.1 putative Ser/Thr protein kinase [Kitasatospora sp. MAP12-44]
MIGRALNGRYELVGMLGVGGMATVYEGVDRVLGRPVAVKVLNGGLAEDPRFAERFGREAQHAAMLVHPRIAMVFDSGMDQGSPYIVMELIRGRSLGSLLAENGPLPVERAVGIASAVCEALEVAHAAGLVHRDIKPGNIMITDDGGVKVVDFGIARASASGQQLTQTATVLGTAAYLSPEQATAAEVDGRTDLYALGCVLVEMLTGQPPFTAETPVAIAFKQVTEEPVPVSHRRPEVPPALDLVTLRMLAKRPADRPLNAAAARAELLAAIPVPGALDRTSELLTGAIADAGGGARTTVLPATPYPQAYQEPPPYQGVGAPTSVMAPLPAYPAEAPARRRPSRGRAVLIGAGVLAGVGVLAAVAFSGSGGGQPAKHPAGASTPVQAAPGANSAAPTPAVQSTPPAASASARPAPSAALAALSAEVAQAQLPGDRQAALLKTLDAASAAISAGRQPVAVLQLKSAQRQVRDLSKKHAVDGATAASWQHQLDSIISSLGNGGANGTPAADNAGADGTGVGSSDGSTDGSSGYVDGGSSDYGWNN